MSTTLRCAIAITGLLLAAGFVSANERAGTVNPALTNRPENDNGWRPPAQQTDVAQLTRAYRESAGHWDGIALCKVRGLLEPGGNPMACPFYLNAVLNSH